MSCVSCDYLIPRPEGHILVVYKVVVHKFISSAAGQYSRQMLSTVGCVYTELYISVCDVVDGLVSGLKSKQT